MKRLNYKGYLRRNNKGSALLAVFLVLMVLTVLGMGIFALSVGSVKQSTVTDIYEKAYYVSEKGSQQGIDFIRYAVTGLYKDIKEECIALNTVSTAKNNANDFFSRLDSSARAYIASPDSYPEAGIDSLVSSISNGAPVAGSANAREYTIQSISTTGNISRIVTAKVMVVFFPIEKKGVTFRDEVLITEGTMTQYSQASMTISGDVIAGSYNVAGPLSNPIRMTSGAMKLLSDVPDATDALNWKIDYDKRLAAGNAVPAGIVARKTASTISTSGKKTTGFADTKKPDQTGGSTDSFSWGVFSGAVPTVYPLRITEASAKPYKFDQWNVLTSVPGELQIDASKNLEISSAISGTPTNRIKIFCDGNLILGKISYADIYALGSVTVGQNCDNVNIYSNGPVTINSTFSNGTITSASTELMEIKQTCTNANIYTNGSLTISGSGSSNLNFSSGGNVIISNSVAGLEGYSAGNFTVSATLSNVKISSAGNLSVTGGNGISGGKIYCGGNFTSGQALTDLQINTIGDFTVNGGNGVTNTEIFCGGNMSINQTCKNTKLNSRGDISLTGGGLKETNKVYSGGSISVTNTSVQGNIVLYAEKNFSVFGSFSFDAKGIVYTNGSINPGSASLKLEGQIAAKNSVTFTSGSFNLINNPSILEALEADPFVLNGTVIRFIMKSMQVIIPPSAISVIEQ